ncbi:hypothetical protein SAMN02910413_1935 [Pseudobutyrivibrio sp. C4]|uniref:DUF5702 domain-containing protein n=1 Tax=Pseudobutyrivibrio sp. C4 TaxID=1520803 RepID=UPI0008ACF09F|nr:DUF5702 domain-containing protein [Pseudobutyrivibrio sp. C4]SET14203.1 hypothetical protein SAMN02910413_1935 [Pseudobutyrivibrio sp. C4]
MKKGSLTVFFALIMVSVMTLIFTMGECIRIYELQDFSQEYTDMAVESGFSEYNPYLWTNYRILAVDLGYGSGNVGPATLEQKILEYCTYNANMEYGSNYARLIPESCSASNYSLLTDSKGAGVVMLGVKAAKDGLAEQIITGVQQKAESINGVEKVSVEQQASDGKAALDNEKAALQEKRQAAATDDNPDTNPSDYPEPEEVEDNPLDAFSVMKESIQKGFLSTVADPEKLSDVQIDLSGTPSHRTLNTGNMEITNGNVLVDKALFVDYLLTSYSYYGVDLKHDGMKYEVEYLIAGKESDIQSLATVLEEIMLIREAANFSTIMDHPSMVAQAQAVADILAGFTMNPAIIEAVKYAVIAAWAYIESTLDVRLLISGGKVPLIKNLDQWTSDVWHLSNFLDVNCKAKPSETGISYKDYLIGFLTLNSNNTLAMRACDVMENALNATEDYKDVKVDNMAFAADVTITYAADEMFMSLLDSSNTVGEYSLSKHKNISY